MNNRLTIVVPKQHPDPRVHSLLFKNNTPFKPKIELKSVLFKRHNKHKKQVFLD